MLLDSLGSSSVSEPQQPKTPPFHPIHPAFVRLFVFPCCFPSLTSASYYINFWNIHWGTEKGNLLSRRKNHKEKEQSLGLTAWASPQPWPSLCGQASSKSLAAVTVSPPLCPAMAGPTKLSPAPAAPPKHRDPGDPACQEPRGCAEHPTPEDGQDAGTLTQCAVSLWKAAPVMWKMHRCLSNLNINLITLLCELTALVMGWSNKFLLCEPLEGKAFYFKMLTCQCYDIITSDHSYVTSTISLFLLNF